MKLFRKGFITGLIVFMACFFFGASSGFGFDVEIDVSPNVLNIQSESVVVTVHTDVAYSLVVGSSVFLNDVKIDHWKADNRGNFVAKFLSEEIKSLNLNIHDYNILTLTGFTTDGEAFIGQQDIKVIDVIPSGKR